MKFGASVLFIFSFVISSLALADGKIGSGGGKASVCRDGQGNVIGAELLDLWEARVLYNENIPDSHDPLETQVAAAVERLQYAIDTTENPGFKQIIAKRTQYFLTDSPEVERIRGVTLTPTSDSFEVASPKDCPVEQVVDYQDHGQSDKGPAIFINQDIFEKMNPTNQAALIIHEAFYASLRLDYNEPNSIRTRRAVGYVFAGNSFQELTSVLPQKRIVCYSLDFQKRYKVYFYQGHKNSTDFVKPLFAQRASLAAIGFFDPDMGMYPAHLEDMLSDSLCDNVPKSGIYPSRSHEIFGSGPVDFDSGVYFNLVCVDGKTNFYLSPDQPIHTKENLSQGEKLNCAIDQQN